jgi:hypothetical protein
VIADPARIILCAKSRWHPAIRREHALSLAAADLGVDVEFIERPYDVRSLVPRFKRAGDDGKFTQPNVTVRRRFVAVPGHRGGAAKVIDDASLRRTLTKSASANGLPDALVVNTPWNWSASAALAPHTRRVFDLADDWRSLFPHRAELIAREYREIADDADEIIVAAPELGALFDRDVLVVPNAAAPEVIQTPIVMAPGGKRMVYVGTLSERFDAAFVGHVLDKLPEWRLDLYGSCSYAHSGDRPDPALGGLLDQYSRRVAWHGPVSRQALPGVLDQGDVLILPNDISISAGQDSMKLYDYAARARPIVATSMRVPVDRPRSLTLAHSVDEFAAAVERGLVGNASENRGWAERNTWPQRVPGWLTGVLGRTDLESEQVA